MLRMMDTVAVPPLGWFFIVQETGASIEGISLSSLSGNVVRHLMANNIPVPPNITSLIEDQICRRTKGQNCAGVDPNHMPSSRLTKDQVLGGTTTILHWLATGIRKVSEGEANRRAAICSTCNHNQDVDDCSTCGRRHVSDIIGKTLGSTKTRFDSMLKNCVSCGCALKASVWCPLDIQLQHMPASIANALPDHCWKKPPTT